MTIAHILENWCNLEKRRFKSSSYWELMANLVNQKNDDDPFMFHNMMSVVAIIAERPSVGGYGWNVCYYLFVS